MQAFKRLVLSKTMNKNLLLLSLTLSASLALMAQPTPCGPAPEMTSFCDEACIICDINGFTGINDDQAQGEAPPGFCTTQVHHMQWIGFIAGSTDLTLSVTVFNCQFNEGLEVGIYRSLDCETFQLVSNCDTDLPPNTTTTFTNTVPLVIGQYYYLVMDGSQDDVCNYTINVISGTTNVTELTTSGALTGPAKACAETPTLFSIDAPTGAASFEWTLDGVKITSGIDTSVVINWATPGVHNVCATASNACDTAAPVCQTVVVTGIPPTVIQAQICAGECFSGADTLLCDPGIYEFHFIGSEGCDSLVRIYLEELQVVSTSLDLFICEDDSIYVGGQAFFESGQFQKILTSVSGCDSIVYLDLEVIACQIKGDLNTSPTMCNGATNGSFQFLLDYGTPPFQYNWARIGTGAPAGTGAVAGLNQTETVSNLPAGTYFVTVSDNFGNSAIFFGDVAEPPALGSQVQLKDFNGFQVSCFGAMDGSIDMSLQGGVPPYSILWDNGSQASQLQSLGAGTYLCTVTDAQGCTLMVQADLAAPEALTLEALFEKPGCDGLSSGSASVVATGGGTTPYTYSLSGGAFGPATEFKDLLPGSYTLTVRDANGCTAAQSAVFVTPLIPEIELGPDLTVDLGEGTRLNLSFNVPLDTFIWSVLPGLSCYDCPQPEATPYHTTTYTLTVSAPGGCTDSDQVRVIVLDKRDVYVPNVFSPDDDGVNETFTVYGGPEVARVRTFQVYSRWGELVFQREDLAPNDEQSGWDGTFRGKPLPPGVYSWVAELEFLDEVSLKYEGSVTIVR